MEADYINNLNKRSIFRNDLVIAESDFNKIKEWNIEETFENIKGGFIGILAPSGSGKSYLLKDILSKIHKNYSKIYLMCPTARFQSIYDYFPDSNIIDHFDEEFLTNMFKQRVEKVERKKSPKKIMVILDDIIGDKEYLKSKILDKLAISARPVNITVIILSQYYSRIKSLHRANLMLFIGFDIDNMDELEKFTRGFMCSVSKRSGRFLYKKITSEKKYQVCVVEIYKNSVAVEEKVKKYISCADVPPFKIKSVVEKDKKGKIGNTENPIRNVVHSDNYL